MITAYFRPLREYNGESALEFTGKLGPDDPLPLRDEDTEYERKRDQEEECPDLV